MGIFNQAIWPALALAITALPACVSPAPAPPPHALMVGGTAPMADIDTCIDEAFTSMAGEWRMRFAASRADGRVTRNEGHLTIAPNGFGRWIILRPDASGAMTPYSEITNYGSGTLESVRLDPASRTIFEETYLECHAADASGRTKFISTLDQTHNATGRIMRTTRTGWASPGHLYSVDIIEATDGSGTYAISTRFGERVGE